MLTAISSEVAVFYWGIKLLFPNTDVVHRLRDVTELIFYSSSGIYYGIHTNFFDTVTGTSFLTRRAVFIENKCG